MVFWIYEVDQVKRGKAREGVNGDLRGSGVEVKQRDVEDVEDAGVQGGCQGYKL